MRLLTRLLPIHSYLYRKALRASVQRGHIALPHFISIRGRKDMSRRRQATLKETGFLMQIDVPSDLKVDVNNSKSQKLADTNTEKRKRSAKLRSSLSDEEPVKRIKEEKKPPASKKKSKSGTGQKNSKTKNGDFVFNTGPRKIPLETPRMAKGSTLTEEEEEEVTDTTQFTKQNDSDSSAKSTGSVSIRIQGSSKKVGTVKPKAKAPRKPKVTDTDGTAKELVDLYIEFDARKQYSFHDGDRLPYELLSNTLEAIEKTSSRLEILRLLCEAFRVILEFNVTDLLAAVYLCINELKAPHEGVKLGIGADLILKAISAASGGLKLEKLKEEYKKLGDLGNLAVKKRSKHNVLKQFTALEISSVYESFLAIANYAGDKPMEAKKGMIEALLHASKGSETKFVVRSLMGKLRIGLAEQTVLQAVGQAFFMVLVSDKNRDTLFQRMDAVVEDLKLVYSQCPSYEIIISDIIKNGVVNLSERVCFTPGIPVQPMLAKPTKGIKEVLDKFTDVPFTSEFKYDGERCQLHIPEDGTVSIFSRNSENLTEKYPDLVEQVPKQIKKGIKSIVLDCESVAYDFKNDKILPFQVLSTRSRKNVEIKDITVNVVLFCFDCLYIDGKSLLNRPLKERREALYNSLDLNSGIIKLAQQQSSSDVEQLQEFLDLAISQNTEGLVVKTLDCTYEPSRRSVNWLKLKKDYIDNLGDSLDLVVIGAWHGEGKRTGIFGSYLLAVYDPEEDQYQTISKIGTGIKDQEAEIYFQQLNKLEIKKPHSNYRYGETLIPDKWFDAEMVWEVKAADFSISPLHKAAEAFTEDDKGISIRFPRLVRVREDKKPNEATTAQQVFEMYKSQCATGSENV